eukprot:scaffold114202_cov21-Tisochrysis_lutea.AAC.2
MEKEGDREGVVMIGYSSAVPAGNADAYSTSCASLVFGTELALKSSVPSFGQAFYKMRLQSGKHEQGHAVRNVNLFCRASCTPKCKLSASPSITLCACVTLPLVPGRDALK